MAAVTFRPAVPADAATVTDLVHAAYGHYLDRLGMAPGPMTMDYVEVIATRETIIAEVSGTAVGVLVLNAAADQFIIENVAVGPTHRGTGVGRALLDLAEAVDRAASISCS